MIPLFKTNYSIGKSILTAESSSDEGEADSIFQIAKKHSLKELVVVEDDISGIMPLIKEAAKQKIKLIYGLVLKIGAESQFHKVCVFAKNAKGLQDLCKLHSIGNAETRLKSFVSEASLKQNFTKDLKLSIPFYDSFLYNNLTSFSSWNFDPKEIHQRTSFFIEDNGLPYDAIIGEKVREYASARNFEIIPAKTILYKDKKDFDAYVTYRCICGRTQGKSRTLSNPNFEGMSSNEFCFESFLENTNV